METIPLHSTEVIEQLRNRMAARREVIYETKTRVETSVTVDYATAFESPQIERKYKYISSLQICSTYRCARDATTDNGRRPVQAVELYRFVHYPISVFLVFTSDSQDRQAQLLSSVVASEDEDKLVIEISRRLYRSIEKICHKRDGLKWANESNRQAMHHFEDMRRVERLCLFDAQYTVVVFSAHSNQILASVNMDPLDMKLPSLKKILKACIPKNSALFVLPAADQHIDTVQQEAPVVASVAAPVVCSEPCASPVTVNPETGEETFLLSVRPVEDCKKANSPAEKLLYLLGVRPTPEPKRRNADDDVMRDSITSEESEAPSIRVVRNDNVDVKVVHEQSSGRPSTADSVASSNESRARSWSQVLKERFSRNGSKKDIDNCDEDDDDDFNWEMKRESIASQNGDEDDDHEDDEKTLVDEEDEAEKNSANEMIDDVDLEADEELDEAADELIDAVNEYEPEKEIVEDNEDGAADELAVDDDDNNAEPEVVEEIIEKQGEGELCSAPPQQRRTSDDDVAPMRMSLGDMAEEIENEMMIEQQEDEEPSSDPLAADDNNDASMRFKPRARIGNGIESRIDNILRKRLSGGNNPSADNQQPMLLDDHQMDRFSEPEEQKKVAEIIQVYEQLSAAVAKYQRQSDYQTARSMLNSYQQRAPISTNSRALSSDAGSTMLTARWQSPVPAQVVINVQVTANPEKAANDDERYTVKDIVWQLNNERPRTLKEALKKLSPGAKPSSIKGPARPMLLDDVPTRRQEAYPVLTVPRCVPHLAAVRAAPAVPEQPAAQLMATIAQQEQMPKRRDSSRFIPQKRFPQQAQTAPVASGQQVMKVEEAPSRRRDEYAVLTHPRFLAQRTDKNKRSRSVPPPPPVQPVCCKAPVVASSPPMVMMEEKAPAPQTAYPTLTSRQFTSSYTDPAAHKASMFLCPQPANRRSGHNF